MVKLAAKERLSEKWHGLDSLDTKCYNEFVYVLSALCKNRYLQLTEPEVRSEMMKRFHTKEE